MRVLSFAAALAIFGLSAAAVLAAPAPAGDAAAGKVYFDKACVLCHAVDAANKTGPSLKGVVGRDIAGVPDFKLYSEGLKGKSGRWADANLNQFLTKPGDFAAGSKMIITVPKEEDRLNVIAYLKTVK